MKKHALLFAALLLFIGTGFQTLNAQEAAIKNRLKTYLDATNAGEWDKVLDMVYDKLFETVPRDQMKQMFSQMSSMGLKMEIKDYTVSKMSETMKEDGNTFVIVHYDAQEKLTLNGPQFSNEQVISQMKSQFNTMYGEGNVTYDKESNSFELKGQKTMLAVNASDADEWKFIEYNVSNPMQAQLFQQIVPEKVLTKLQGKE